MTASVTQLRSDALDGTIRVSDLLRRALFLATELDLPDFRNWVNAELRGYPDGDDVPDYRRVAATLGGLAPGTDIVEPLLDTASRSLEEWRATIRFPVASIESMLSGRSWNFHVSLDHGAQQEIELEDGEDERHGWHYLFIVNRSSLEYVLDSIRTAVLDQALELEPDALDRAPSVAANEDDASGDGRATGRGASSDVPAAGVSSTPSVPGEEEPRQECVFRRDGNVWTVCYEGKTTHLSDTKGMQTLHVLISHSGEEYDPVELLDAVEGVTPPSPGNNLVGSPSSLIESGLEETGFSNAGEMTDERALREVRDRSRQLQSEIDEAKEQNDFGKLERLTEEKEALEDYLFKSVDHRGRPRKARDDYATMRSRVHQNVIRGLEVIEEEHPNLHRHLANAIQTTPSFSYRPDRHMDWDV